MRNKLKLTVLIAVLVIGVGVLVFGKIYLIRDDSGGDLLWDGSEAYLFMDVRHRGFQIGYLEYPWVVLKELLYGVQGPDDQRTSVTVVHITASGVDRHVVEALDEEQANTPDLYTPFEDYIYANYHGSLCKWTGNKFETATAEEQSRLDFTNRLVATDIEKDTAGWSKRGFGEAVSDYEFAVEVGGKFTLHVTNKRLGRSGGAVVSVTLARPGQPVEDVWRVDGRPRRVSKTEYQIAFKR
ncbi:MAG: hypothetical protein WB781_23750 [Candidatus Sulfotelmatobacter sp.]